MSKNKKDALFKLIKSLSKPEKRHFKLYANRTVGQKERKFMLLFDILDKLDSYNETIVLKKLEGQTTKGKLSNLKRHLYKQILTSLRLTHISKQLSFEIREQIDFANILYYKGMYMESLRILERIRIIAEDNHQDILQIEIIHFQKMIESRHITRSRKVDKKLERLLEDSELRSEMARASSALVSFNIKSHGYYIVHGFAQTEKDRAALEIAWTKMQPKAYNTEFKDTFFEKANRLQSLMWYRYIRLDFLAALEHTQAIANHFDTHTQMKSLDSNFYVRSIYYQLVFLFLLKDKLQYKSVLTILNQHIEQHLKGFTPIEQQVAFVYQSLSQLNYWILLKDFRSAQVYSDSIKASLTKYENDLDDHRVLLFHYKFASIAFGLKQYEQALDYLHPLLHHSKNILRREMDINARLLELMCLYETKDFSQMDYRLASLSKSLSKFSKPAQLQVLSKNLLRDCLQFHASKKMPAIIDKHLAIFQEVAKLPREVIFLSYLDVLSWLESKPSS